MGGMTAMGRSDQPITPYFCLHVLEAALHYLKYAWFFMPGAGGSSIVIKVPLYDSLELD